ncbi:FHA domain-containing protein [Cryobacterium aureum]|uniref:FHA domain-containing protein n=1 Tax=Cryobacterium aureum TaxID=995037 RepID=UPI000CF4FE22|nr:FHA domain-containing protein [Cryobacterium aureum]
MSSFSGSTAGGAPAKPTVSLHIDLAFSMIEPPGAVGASTAESRTDSTGAAFGDSFGAADAMQGTVTANGTEITIFTSNPEMFVQGRALNLDPLRGLAAELAARGLTVAVTGPVGLIARLGHVQASVSQRLMTRSPHIVLGSRNALGPLVQARLRGKSRMPVAIPLPPSTVFPLAPTFDRHRRGKITTTHYTPGSGRPRLIFVVGSENWNGQMPREFNLLPGTTTIGSSADADLQLPGLKPLHAEIRHDHNDEYRLFAIGTVAGSSRPTEDGRSIGNGQILRTGSRLEMGPWRMGYFREEFADHGRPFGGRVGGELAVQKPQPPRPRA